jgi:hypothetical protein
MIFLSVVNHDHVIPGNNDGLVLVPGGHVDHEKDIGIVQHKISQTGIHSQEDRAMFVGEGPHPQIFCLRISNRS